LTGRKKQKQTENSLFLVINESRLDAQAPRLRSSAPSAVGYCCRQLLKCCDKFGLVAHLYAKCQQFFSSALLHLMMMRPGPSPAGSCLWKVILKTALRMDYFLFPSPFGVKGCPRWSWDFERCLLCIAVQANARRNILV